MGRVNNTVNRAFKVSLSTFCAHFNRMILTSKISKVNVSRDRPR